MHGIRRPRVKICCIQNIEEARKAIAEGVSAIGLVSAMPGGPGIIPEELIAQIAAAIPPPIATFLLTSLKDAEAIIAQHRRCRTNTIQLVDRLPVSELEKLREELPGIGLVQVVHITSEDALAEAGRVAPYADALLLDSGNPELKVKELGGTGRIHDWRISRMIRESIEIPVFLAGGLKPENVYAAMNAVEPFGIDVCSGVRTDGRLDMHKLGAFCAAAGL